MDVAPPVVGDVQGGRGNANLMLVAVRALCRHAPYRPKGANGTTEETGVTDCAPLPDACLLHVSSGGCPPSPSAAPRRHDVPCRVRFRAPSAAHQPPCNRQHLPPPPPPPTACHPPLTALANRLGGHLFGLARASAVVRPADPFKRVRPVPFRDSLCERGTRSVGSFGDC